MPTKTTRKVPTDSKRSGKAKRRGRDRKRTATVTFSVIDFDLLDRMVGASGVFEVESCCASDITTFIHNQGGPQDRAEALAAVLPLAARLYERLYPEE